MPTLETYAELYTFNINNNYILRFTNYTEDITLGTGEKFLKAVIDREEINFSKEITEILTTIHVQVTNDTVSLIYLTDIPFIEIDINGYNISDGSIFDICHGFIKDISLSNSIISLRISPINTDIEKKIPPFIYQSMCNNTLFDINCGLSKVNYEVNTAIDSITSNVEFVITAASNYNDNYFDLGVIHWNGEMRMITNHTGNSIRIHFPFSTLPKVGDKVILYPGCDRTVNTCKNKFNNFNNFTGFPYIPSKNPTIWGVE